MFLLWVPQTWRALQTTASTMTMNQLNGSGSMGGGNEAAVPKLSAARALQPGSNPTQRHRRMLPVIAHHKETFGIGRACLN
mmetsp:Transcript_13553/g.28291  ORF Transcript_13553/g.28291 Transcript_13553/m.28291 type:complete len:81 (+) Transcript_13553:126-368(+)